MIIIKHRRNSIRSLKMTPKKFGVEIDLRTFNKDIIVEHEPFINSTKFIDWIKYYKHKFLILNIKEERIEFHILKILKKYKISDYFFLDSTIPMIDTLNKKKFFDIALRISFYENHKSYIDLAYKNIKNKWIWLDTIDGNIPISLKQLQLLKNIGYRICMVSPELPLKSRANMNSFEKRYKAFFNYIDAICTKKSNFWKKYEN